MHDPSWADDLDASVIATDAAGVITYMNRRALEQYADEGGAALLGRSLFDCHPERAARILRGLFAQPRPNHYTVSKRGRRKIIHQLPRMRDGVFAGYVEISVVIPESMLHFDRG